MTMYSDLIQLIRRSLEDARARGRDDLDQADYAVRTVMTVRPDLTAAEAATAVDEVRWT